VQLEGEGVASEARRRLLIFGKTTVIIGDKMYHVNKRTIEKSAWAEFGGSRLLTNEIEFHNHGVRESFGETIFWDRAEPKAVRY